MSIKPITEIVDYLDEDFNPVEDKSKARYKNTTEFNLDGSIKDQNMQVLIDEQLQETTDFSFQDDNGDMVQDPPLSQAFTDEGNNPHNDIEVLPTVDPNEEGLHNTGKDLSRTGPEGNWPRDNYDPIHYTGQQDVKINIPTPYYQDNAKQIYDVPGTPPELQEVQIKLDEEDVQEFNFSETLPEEFLDDRTQGFTHSSSFIGHVEYRKNLLQMDITMNGKSYTYCGLQQIDYDQFKGAPSKGRHLHSIIGKNFQCSGPRMGSGALSEALNIYKDKQPDEFNWINDEDISDLKDYSEQRGKGKFILAVASGESVTDHRPEGRESMRRKWTQNEMMQNIRTSKGKLIDINHTTSKIDPHSGGIYDANWNDKTKRGEMIIYESDEKILEAIRNNIITAVSINTGKPRKVETNCDNGECFIEPVGTILGELNGVALAYVVTDPGGFDYHGVHIPALPPGMQITKIYLVE